MPHNTPEPLIPELAEPASAPADHAPLDSLAPSFFADDPLPFPEPVNGPDLLNELEATFKSHLILPNHAAEMLALWVVHTYAFHLRDVSAYVGVESPEKRCGKSTLLALLSELVFRPVVAANISSSAFFRVIEQTQPTLIIDEADTFLRGNDQLRGILNAGYTRRTAFVVRVGRSRKQGLVRYSCWCPKIMAAIGRLPDTLADRCILVQMQRKLAYETCQSPRFFDGSILRRKCARFVHDYRAQISTATPQVPPTLNDRAADIWNPLLVLADLAGNDWPTKARDAALGLAHAAQMSTPGGALLLDLFLMFINPDRDRVSTAEILQHLNFASTGRWREALRGKEVSDIWLATQLRRYGVRPHSLRFGNSTQKGYHLDDLRSIFKRYITKADLLELKLHNADDANMPNDQSSPAQAMG